MKLQSFNLLKTVQRIYDTFTRNDIERSCDQAIEKIRDNALPIFDKALENFPTSNFAHEESKRLAKIFALRSKMREPMIKAMHGTLRTAQAILEEVAKRAETLYSTHETGTALSYKKAVYIQMIAVCSFAESGAMATLNYLMALEAEAADENYKATDTFSAGEIRLVVERLPQLANICGVLSEGADKLLGAMDKAPADTLLNEKSFTILSASNHVTSDPLAAAGLDIEMSEHGFIGDGVSPFLMIAKIFAGLQTKRYQRSQAQREVIAMRLQMLKEQAAGHPTAAMQKKIESLSNQLNRLETEISQMEKRYGVEGGV